MAIKILYLKQLHEELANVYNEFLKLEKNDLNASTKGKIKEALIDSLIVKFSRNYSLSKNTIYKILFEEFGLDKDKELRTINLILKSAYLNGLIENIELWIKYKQFRNIIENKTELEEELQVLDYIQDFLADEKILIDNIDRLLKENSI